MNEVYTAQEVATELKLNPGTLAIWRIKGRGPKFLKIGRRVRYTRADLDEWLTANRFANTSAYEG